MRLDRVEAYAQTTETTETTGSSLAFCLSAFSPVAQPTPSTLDSSHKNSQNGSMRVIAKRRLREFWEPSPELAEAKAPSEAWHEEVAAAVWDKPQQVKAQFRHASILKDSRVVFNIKGNNYRLVAKINYPYQVIYVRFVGTHQQYDDINVETI